MPERIPEQKRVENTLSYVMDAKAGFSLIMIVGLVVVFGALLWGAFDGGDFLDPK